MAENSQVCQALEPEQQEAVRKAAGLARQYLAFKSTAAIRQHLIGLAQEHGFIGMLARTTQPFEHAGFACAVPLVIIIARVAAHVAAHVAARVAVRCRARVLGGVADSGHPVIDRS